MKASIQDKLDKYFKVKGSAKEVDASGSEIHGHRSGPDIRLPPITLPTFDGKNPKQWIYFRDNFPGLIANKGLDYPQMVHYLYISLGEDPKIVMGNPVYTEEGYNEAWRLLKKRYDNSKAMIED